MLSLFVLVAFASAQTRTVSGKVTDSKGDGVPSATVLVKGTKVSTTTAADGSFTLNGVPANASTLVIVAFILIYGAIGRFINPQVIESGLVIWLALLGIIVNGLSVVFLRKDAEHNINMKSAYLHLLTDMMASVAVLTGGLLMKYYEIYWVDSVMTLLIALYLIVVGFDLFIKSTKMLMLFTPDTIDIKEIVREVHQIKGVGKLHHIHVWHLNEEELHLEAHLDCAADLKMSEFNDLLHEIEEVLYEKFNINHVNIQPEFQKVDPKDFIVQD